MVKCIAVHPDNKVLFSVEKEMSYQTMKWHGESLMHGTQWKQQLWKVYTVWHQPHGVLGKAEALGVLEGLVVVTGRINWGAGGALGPWNSSAWHHNGGSMSLCICENCLNLRVKADTLQVVMMYHYRFSCNTHATLLGDDHTARSIGEWILCAFFLIFLWPWDSSKNKSVLKWEN